MFLKNSITLLLLGLHFFTFSLQNQILEKDKLIIPKQGIEETIKMKSNKIKVKQDLHSLSIHDRILIKKENEVFYYRVIDKKEILSLEDTRNYDSSSLILYNTQPKYSFMIVAEQTGKMVKKL